jgi:hypothetical protein
MPMRTANRSSIKNEMTKQHNRYCLLDKLETAFQLARDWSSGNYDANGSYIGPAEHGLYFVVEVFRKRLEAS